MDKRKLKKILLKCLPNVVLVILGLLLSLIGTHTPSGEPYKILMIAGGIMAIASSYDIMKKFMKGE